MTSRLSRFGGAFWKVFWIFALADLLLIVGLVKGITRIQKENRDIEAEVLTTGGVSSNGQRVVLLEKENQRLKSELNSIPELAAKKQELQSLDAASQPKDLLTLSNHIEQAIERNRAEAKEIYDWMRNHERMRREQLAQARLLEKTATESQAPEAIAVGYQRLQSLFQKAGLAMKEQIEARQEWIRSDKSDQSRTAFQARFSQARQSWESALTELGPDRVLYQELIVPFPINDPSRTAVLRSYIPDTQGKSATVYLDGSVVFSPDKP